MEPYDEWLGSGKITSVSYPVYLRTQEPPIFIGVVGVDVFMGLFEGVEGDEDVILEKLVTRSIKCSQNNLTEWFIVILFSNYFVTK